MSNNKNNCGKGSAPRNIFSQQFRDNFSQINWRRPVICPGCKNKIEPDLCCCGKDKNQHGLGYWHHGFVPMGCTCFFPKDEVAAGKY